MGDNIGEYETIRSYFINVKKQRVDILKTVKCSSGLCGQPRPAPSPPNINSAFSNGFDKGFS